LSSEEDVKSRVKAKDGICQVEFAGEESSPVGAELVLAQDVSPG